MPTESHLGAYLRHLENHRRLASTSIDGYRQELTRLVKLRVPFETEPLAVHITRRIDGGLRGPAARNRLLVIIRGFSRFLVVKGVLPTDPTASIERARVPRTIKIALDVDSLDRVLGLIRSRPATWRRTRDEVIIQVFFYTGLRVSELRSLNLDQVDLERRTLRATHRKGGSLVDVPLNDKSAAALSRWLADRPSSSDQAVFIGTRTLRRLSVRSIQKTLKKLGDEAGVPLHPHALRHAHATALLRVGVSVEVIRQSLHHSSLQTTQRYLHSDDHLLRTALAKMPPLCGRTEEIPQPDTDR